MQITTTFDGTLAEYQATVGAQHLGALALARLDEIQTSLAALGINQETLMALIDDLKARAIEVREALEASNNSFDALIVSNQEIADALRALQAQPTVTAADIQAVLDELDGALTSARQQKAEGDAALAANDITPDPQP